MKPTMVETMGQGATVELANAGKALSPLNITTALCDVSSIKAFVTSRLASRPPLAIQPQFLNLLCPRSYPAHNYGPATGLMVSVYITRIRI